MRFPSESTAPSPDEVRYRFSRDLSHKFHSDTLHGIRRSIAELGLPKEVLIRFDVPFVKPGNQGIVAESDLRIVDDNQAASFTGLIDAEHYLELVMQNANSAQQMQIMEAISSWPAIADSNPTGIPPAEEVESVDKAA